MHDPLAGIQQHQVEIKIVPNLVTKSLRGLADSLQHAVSDYGKILNIEMMEIADNVNDTWALRKDDRSKLVDIFERSFSENVSSFTKNVDSSIVKVVLDKIASDGNAQFFRNLTQFFGRHTLALYLNFVDNILAVAKCLKFLLNQIHEMDHRIRALSKNHYLLRDNNGRW